jgi:hypothetical protein
VRVLLLQLDGKIPNIALMRLAAHHRQKGDEIEFRIIPRIDRVDSLLWDQPFERVYASTIFERTRSVAERVREVYPGAVIGGTGWNFTTSLESIGVTTTQQDYSIYPRWQQSIGFSQRGCRLKCAFCCVPKTEGSVRYEQTIEHIWRGDPWPREIILLDNDFFGQPDWNARIQELRDGHFKVSFNQGINARFLTDETAAAIASIDYRDDSMKVKRIYTAWDNRKDEERLFRGLRLLTKYGVKPDHIMVYMLCGYWPDETEDDRNYRRHQLREFGCRPYPMPYHRTHELVGFQRWVIGAYDKRISWEDWKRADYEPRKLAEAQP